MTESGAEIAKLEALRVRLRKTKDREAVLADRNRALVHQHEQRFQRAADQLDKVDAKLTALMDKKLDNLVAITEESGEYQESWRD